MANVKEKISAIATIHKKRLLEQQRKNEDSSSDSPNSSWMANQKGLQQAKSSTNGVSSLSPPKKTMQKIFRSESPNLAYKVKMMFRNHHIVNCPEPLCLPNKIPEKSLPHLRGIEFEKSPKRFIIQKNKKNKKGIL